MSQTILIEDNDDIRKLFALNLQTYVGTDVIHRRSAEDTIELLSILPTVNLIITRNEVEGMPCVDLILTFLKDNGLEIPIICLGENKALGDNGICLKEPVMWENLIKISAKLLGVNLEAVSKRIRPDYVPVSIAYFYELSETPCDVYIQIKKSPTQHQYIKRIHSKDTFDREAIEKYEYSGLKDFFVPKDFEQYFINFVSNQIIKKLEGDMSVEDRLVTTATSYDLVNDSVIRIGMDQGAVDLSDISVQSMVTSVKENPRLNKLLGFLFTSKISYAYQRCHMTSVICHHILSKLEINKATHLEVLSFVSFFADITLKTRTQIEINTQAELDNSSLDNDDRLTVLYHARDAANLMKDHPNAPEGIERIIRETHGMPTGIGFSDNPPEDLHNLSKIFIVADAFVKRLLNYTKYKEKSLIIEELTQQFANPSYQKIIKVLEGKIE
jgi:hypothetical protein